MTAWTARPTTSTGCCPSCSAASRYAAFRPKWLTGSLAELELAVLVNVAIPAAEGTTSTIDIWHSLGGQLKPSISVQVTAPMIGDRDDAAAS